MDGRSVALCVPPGSCPGMLGAGHAAERGRGCQMAEEESRRIRAGSIAYATVRVLAGRVREWEAHSRRKCAAWVWVPPDRIARAPQDEM